MIQFGIYFEESFLYLWRNSIVQRFCTHKLDHICQGSEADNITNIKLIDGNSVHVDSRILRLCAEQLIE